MIDSIFLLIDVELVSESNAREHWTKKARRKKAQRQAVRAGWVQAGQPRLTPPIQLTLTRIAPARRFIRDYDNLSGCFKAVIDEVADIAGINDKDIVWADAPFRQKKGEMMQCKIQVESLADVGADLTEMQREFLVEWIKQRLERGIPPTLRELKNGFTWNTQQLLDYVVQKGYIDKTPGVARGCRLTERGQAFNRLAK